MKKSLASKLVPLTLVGALAFSQMSCGILFHPSRSHSNAGRLDVFAVLLDCCWLFVGLVPGVVALAIDFSTGGAWHSASDTSLAPGDGVALRIAGPAPAACEVSLRLVDASGCDLAPAARTRVERGEHLDHLVLPAPRAMSPGAELVLAIDGREQGRWAVTK